MRKAPLTKLLGSALLTLGISACSTTYHPNNEPISEVDETGGYRRLSVHNHADHGESLILLAFSGGGTRAAALSYGVMQELRDTVVVRDDQTLRLLDDVDSISSVSGGSFTAAYYGLYRDRLFEDFEDDFLRQGVQRALIRQLLNPAHWFRSTTSGFDRTEMAVSYYDRKIFKGATFSDMAANGPPYIDINATDLSTGMRFTFNQELFDLICTDLGSFPVARAVTASSAVPGVFPTIVLKNHADQCEITDTREWELLVSVQAEGESEAKLLEMLKSYRDVENRQYIHLVDGGVADNLGLRAMLARVNALGEAGLDALEENQVENILLVLVNAQVKPERFIERSPKKPSLATSMSAYTSAQMNQYNQETLDRLQAEMDALKQELNARGMDTQLFFTEVSFDHVQNSEVNRFLNSMPTSLELEDIEVDRLALAGRMLLRHDPQFSALRERIGASLVPGAVTEEEVCEAFGQSDCPGTLETINRQ